MKRALLYASLLAFVTLAAGSPAAQTNGNAAAADPAKMPTPRTADGKPDLTGIWAAGAGGGGGGGRDLVELESGKFAEEFPSRRCGPTQVKCGDYTNQSEDGEFTARMNPNRPLYKPEHWDKVQQLDMWTNKFDPLFFCQPLGLPRAGAPNRMFLTGNDLVMMYNNDTSFRVVPVDGRKHDPVKSQDVLFWGHSVGRWEGDTLVIDSVGFNDLTWIDKGGFFTSENKRVIEKFTRVGDTLRYEVTVEDPDVLAEPWVMTPRMFRINPNKDAGLVNEATPCRDYDHANMVTQIRH